MSVPYVCASVCMSVPYVCLSVCLSHIQLYLPPPKGEQKAAEGGPLASYVKKLINVKVSGRIKYLLKVLILKYLPLHIFIQSFIENLQP